MKPLGLGFTASESGIGMSVRRPSKVEDAVWEAVEMAIQSGWTPEQFRNEIADAWREKLRDEIKHAVDVLSR